MKLSQKTWGIYSTAAVRQSSGLLEAYDPDLSFEDLKNSNLRGDHLLFNLYSPGELILFGENVDGDSADAGRLFLMFDR